MGCQYKRAYDNREVKLVIVSESARAVLFKFCTNNLEAYKSPAGKNFIYGPVIAIVCLLKMKC